MEADSNCQTPRRDPMSPPSGREDVPASGPQHANWVPPRELTQLYDQRFDSVSPGSGDAKRNRQRWPLRQLFRCNDVHFEAPTRRRRDLNELLDLVMAAEVTITSVLDATQRHQQLCCMQQPEELQQASLAFVQHCSRLAGAKCPQA